MCCVSLSITRRFIQRPRVGLLVGRSIGLVGLSASRSVGPRSVGRSVGGLTSRSFPPTLAMWPGGPAATRHARTPHSPARRSDRLSLPPGPIAVVGLR